VGRILISVLAWKADVRLPGNGNSNYHGARPVHLIITMIKCIRNSRLYVSNSLSLVFEARSAYDVACGATKPHRRADQFSSGQNRGTSHIRNRPTLGHYSSPLPRDLLCPKAAALNICFRGN
jgi:hypothetical protein